jgi:hypothetical protein
VAAVLARKSIMTARFREWLRGAFEKAVGAVGKVL